MRICALYIKVEGPYVSLVWVLMGLRAMVGEVNSTIADNRFFEKCGAGMSRMFISGYHFLLVWLCAVCANTRSVFDH